MFQIRIDAVTIYCKVTRKHGVRHRGGQGAMAPPDFTREGASNALGPPPDFRKNSVMYTINVQCFSLKNQLNAYIIVFILLKNLNF